MKKLSAWLKRKGFKIRFRPGSSDEVNWKPKFVQINSRTTKTTQVAVCLHECGHVLINESRLKQSKQKKQRKIAGASYQEDEMSKGRMSRNTYTRKIAIITEEIEAWERGWNLSKRLGLKISRKKYENVRIKALMTYVNWVAK